MKFDEKANELVAAYGEACKAFAWFRPYSLRDMVRAENALVGFIAALEAENAEMRKAMELVQNAVNSGEHPDYIIKLDGQVLFRAGTGVCDYAKVAGRGGGR